MINNQEELEKLIKSAKKNDSIAIDTEFVWERTYFPKLGLIQIGLSNDDCRLIDPLTLEDLTPLKEILEDESVVKILHDAPQDLTILHRATGAHIRNVFDTRLAAGFCGLTSTISLSYLIEELLDILLPKTETRTNWLKRPLDNKQILYAEDDVRYLRAIRILLLTRAYSPEVKSYLEEEMMALNNPEIYTPLPDNERYKRVKGAKGLSRQGLAILKELALWREVTAREKDRPRNHIVPDNVLVTIAKKQLRSEQSIKNETPISQKALKKYGKHLVDASQKGLDYQNQELPGSLKIPRLSAKEKNNVEKLSQFIRLKSDTKGIDPVLVATTSELKRFVKHLNSPERGGKLKQNHGWRKKFLAEFFI